MAARPPRDNDPRPDARERPERGAPAEETPSFGSFVSDSVRRSAGRFRGEAEPPRPRRSARRAEADATGEPERFGVPRRRERRERQERRETSGTFVPVRDPDLEEEPRDIADRPVWMQEVIDRAGSPERALAAGAIALVALIALIWALAALVGDDNGGGQGTATEVLQVVPVGQGGTPDPAVGPNRGIVTPTPPGGAGDEPSSAPAGSDNVLDQIPSSPVTGGGGSPSATCNAACLARVERTPEASALLLANGTRPSYTGDGWYWIIAEPDAIQAISSVLETEVIRESTDTLRLYMVTLPGPDSGDWAAWELGEVIDTAGSYRLVETPSAPANVEVAVDNGFGVEKVAPAPMGMRQRPGGLPALTEENVGGVANDIDTGNLQQTIAEMQVMGGNGGLGSRHYRTVGNQVAAEYLYQKLESYGLTVWYEDFISWDGLLLVNVIGEIPGRDTSRLYGVMAHLDTISTAPHTVAPGADDNASGVAATLEIARILAEYDLRYSMRVIFINYEEEGVVGAQEFAREAVARGDPWEGIFNIDSVGSSRNGNWIVLNGGTQTVWMQELMQRINDVYGLGHVLRIEQSDEIVADDSRLRSEGIESVLIARELFGWSPTHHTEQDVLETVSISHTASAGQLVLLTVAHLML